MLYVKFFMKISALVIVKNEEKKLNTCLLSLSFVDEVVIVLDRCNDNSKKISKTFTDKIFEGEWEFEGDRRNFGIQKCSSEWILEIDADEIVSKNLAKEIKNQINYSKFDYHYIYLTNYVYNIPILNGWTACLAPEGKFCLFKKNSKIWDNQRVHPDYKLNGEKGFALKSRIQHKMSDNISELVLRFNRNTDLRAMDLRDSGKSFSKYLSIRKIFSRFLKCYIIKKGYKDGLIGLLISILSSIYPIVSAIKSRNI